MEDKEEGFEILRHMFEVLGISEPEYHFVKNNGSGNSIFPYVVGKERIENISLHALEIRDSDSMPKEMLEKIIKKESRRNAQLVYLSCHEIENCLIKSKLVSKALKEKGVHCSDKEIKKILTDAMQAPRTRDRILDNLRSVIRQKITSHYRDLEIDFKDIPELAEKAFKEIRDNNYEYPFALLPGKEVFGVLKSEIHRLYNVKINELEIAALINIENIPEEIISSAGSFREKAKKEV